MYAGGNARDASDVERAVQAYGAAPGGSAMLKSENRAAEEAMRSGVYVTWQSPGDERECCRVGQGSSCLCGHALKSHGAPKGGGARLRPPACAKCARCPAFRYAPSRPEECGQWWLPRRKDFDPRAWRARVRQRPHEYCCLNCDSAVDAHETVFEPEAARRASGRPVGDAFRPLSETPGLAAAVLGSAADTTPEALVAAGRIGAAEYRSRIVEDRATGATFSTNVGLAPPPRGPGAYVRPR